MAADVSGGAESENCHQPRSISFTPTLVPAGMFGVVDAVFRGELRRKDSGRAGMTDGKNHCRTFVTPPAGGGRFAAGPPAGCCA